MYTGIICCAVIITVYFIAMAVISSIRSGLAIFSWRSTLCVILGSILGILVSEPLFAQGKEWGYAGFGLSIGLMYILFFSGIIGSLLDVFPVVRRVFNVIIRILRAVLIVAVIVLAVMGILHLVGV